MKRVLVLAVGALVVSQSGVLAQCAFSAAKGKSVCATATGCSAPVQAAEVEATISTDALAALLRTSTAVAVLDARSGKYDDGRRIPGAKSLSSKASTEQIAAVAGADKDALIVTYCSGVKCPASKRLATVLRDSGYTNVLEYPQGIEGWTKAGKTVVSVN